MRDVEPVLAAEGEEEVVARDAGDRLRLEAEELADAVILVDDVVADAQVGEGGERAAEPRVRARRALAEDLRVGQEDEAEVAPDEAAPRRRDREADGRRRAAAGRRLVDRALDLAQEAALPERLAAVRERDDDAVARAHEPGELVLRLGEPAGGDRRPLRLELERLPARERVELRRTLQARPARAPPPPRRARTSSGCQTKSGAPVDRRDEIVRHGDRARGRLLVLPPVRALEARRRRRAARRPGRRSPP